MQQPLLGLVLDTALDNNLHVFGCRGRRLFFRGEEDGPGGDHRAGAAEGQRVLVKRGGPGRPGRSQHSRYALSGGWSQSAAIYKWQLCHFHTREHTWRTAVSGALTHIIRRESDTDTSPWLSPQLLCIDLAAIVLTDVCVRVWKSWEIMRILRDAAITGFNTRNTVNCDWHLWQSEVFVQDEPAPFCSMCWW